MLFWLCIAFILLIPVLIMPGPIDTNMDRAYWTVVTSLVPLKERWWQTSYFLEMGVGFPRYFAQVFASLIFFLPIIIIVGIFKKIFEPRSAY